MTRIGIVGYGYWGPNMVRNFQALEGVQVTWVADLSEDRLRIVRSLYPAVRTTTKYDELMQDGDLDAVVVATPVSTHHELAMLALAADKHVLVEKPLADSSEKCAEMITIAEERGKVLMVDHTFPYTAAVRRIKKLIEDGELGRLYYYDSVRVNLGLFQHDVNVIWDLAVHDLSILEFIVSDRPVAVSATGMGHVEDRPENIAYMTLFYDNDFIAHIHVNWLAPVKLRQTLIGGSEKMVVYNDVESTEKVKVYDKGITLGAGSEDMYQMRVEYRAGDVWSPHLPNSEALRLVATEFVDSMRGKKNPTTDGPSGMRVVRIMEAATESMQQRGKVVDLAL